MSHTQSDDPFGRHSQQVDCLFCFSSLSSNTSGELLYNFGTMNLMWDDDSTFCWALVWALFERLLYKKKKIPAKGEMLVLWKT